MTAAMGTAGSLRERFRIGIGEAAGAVADLGVMVPLAAALILVNGLEPGTVLLAAGVLVLGSGAAFGVPFPVQPLKALTAVAVAQGVAPGVIHAAGLEIGLFLLLLSIGRLADLIAGIFTRPVVRALQLGVGLLLLLTAVRLVREPPDVFLGTPPSPWPVLLALAAFPAVLWAARSHRYWVVLAIVGVGAVAAWVVATPAIDLTPPQLPDHRFPSPGELSTAFFLLVIPQLPLTFGNAVVAVSDLAREYFGPRARAVRPSTVCLSAGLGNVASALLGGMPMCHGAGGLTAHYRLGARTAGMNAVLGAAFLALGLFLAPQVMELLGLVPVWALAAFLSYAGLRHALLIRDLSGWPLAVAVAAGTLGAALGNLAVTTALVLGFELGRRGLGRLLEKKRAARWV